MQRSIEKKGERWILHRTAVATHRWFCFIVLHVCCTICTICYIACLWDIHILTLIVTASFLILYHNRRTVCYMLYRLILTPQCMPMILPCNINLTNYKRNHSLMKILKIPSGIVIKIQK